MFVTAFQLNQAPLLSSKTRKRSILSFNFMLLNSDRLDYEWQAVHRAQRDMRQEFERLST